jgi:hypothetical protein
MTTETLLYIPMRESLYNALVLHFSKPGQPASGIDEVIDSVVADFLDRVSEGDDNSSKVTPRGFYWQNVFLQNGSQLRMTIHGKQHFAMIEHEGVSYEGQVFTPASWANHVAGHSRNAWRDIYIKRPADGDWVFANSLRR